MMTLFDTISNTVHNHHLIQKGDRIAIGVSGGADSVALLLYFVSIRDSMNLDLIVCHCNHRLRGEDSDKDADFTRSLAKRFSVSYEDIIFDFKNGFTEEKGRQARYSFFRQVAGPSGKIATAHHANDQAETVIMHLARGSGLTGLSGIPYERDGIIRPMLDCSRQDIEEFLRENNQPFRCDSSNEDPTYTRNYVRKFIVPAFLEVNPNFLDAVARCSSQIRDIDSLLGDIGQKAIDEMVLPDGSFSTVLFQKNNLSIRHWIFKNMLKRIPIDPSSQLIDRMDSTLFSLGQFSLCSRKWYFYADRNICNLYYVPDCIHSVSFQKSSLTIQSTVSFHSKKNIHFDLIHCSFQDFCNNFNNYPLKYSIDYDKIIGQLSIRSRAPGDFMSITPNRQVKPLNELFRLFNLPPLIRDTLPVITDDTGIIWVEGLGIDSRVLPDNSTTSFLLITCSEV